MLAHRRRLISGLASAPLDRSVTSADLCKNLGFSLCPGRAPLVKPSASAANIGFCLRSGRAPLELSVSAANLTFGIC